jgi:hypothetical protein
MTIVPLSLDTADGLARGELSVIQFNRRYTYRLSKREWPIYEAAKQAGYIILPHSENSYRRIEHVWSDWCEPRYWPMTAIKPRMKYALIDSDQIALPARALPSHEQLAPIRRLFEEHTKGGWYSVDPTYIAISRVPIEVAPFIAARIVAVLWSALGLAPLSTTEVKT